MIAHAKSGKILLTPWFDLITKSDLFYSWYGPTHWLMVVLSRPQVGLVQQQARAL